MKPISKKYNLKRIRALLTDGFTDEELRHFCFDTPEFRPVYDQLSQQTGKSQLVQALLEYTEHKDLFDTLLEQIKESNPHKYARYKPYDIMTGPLPPEPTPTTITPLEKASESTPINLEPSAPTRVFICHKRDLAHDEQLAVDLQKFLTTQGCEVFIDLILQPGQNWLDEIDRRIKASDFFITLLSKEAANSEMVQAEIWRAYEHRQRQKHPRLLPVRLAYEELLPYAIDAFLNPLQYVLWRTPADNERVCQDILAAITHRSLPPQPVRAQPLKKLKETTFISEDGSFLLDENSINAPLPAFDPRFLDELEAPGGTVKLRDKFYIEREADNLLKRQMGKGGALTTIRASRQKGKSSLLVRGMQYARENGANTVMLDLQRVDDEYLANHTAFWGYLAEFVTRKLHLDVSKTQSLWAGKQGPQEKLTCLFEEYLLPASNVPLMLAIDEADHLLQTDFYNDFFSLIRSWYNSAAYEAQWDKLNLTLVISTEPHLLIADLNQSPFNVGLKLYLENFNYNQVHDLNWRHGSPVNEKDFLSLMTLLNGHPYLTRKALYTLATQKLTWAELTRVAAEDDGPFGDHLRHQHWLLGHESALKTAFSEIVLHNRCADEMSFFRLLRAGLVQRENDDYTCSCDLYRLYFADKL
jgi:hypothetical protein